MDGAKRGVKEVGSRYTTHSSGLSEAGLGGYEWCDALWRNNRVITNETKTGHMVTRSARHPPKSTRDY